MTNGEKYKKAFSVLQTSKGDVYKRQAVKG